MGVMAADRFPVGAKASKGILKFATREEKDTFRKALRDNKFDKSFEGNRLYIEDNDLDKDEKDKRRAVGKVKRALMEAKSDRNDVTALRPQGEVWIGDERVAKWVKGYMKLRGEALSLKARIDELIAHRPKPDELSE
eukprot:5232952-Karenia_brevis.AAC.1